MVTHSRGLRIALSIVTVLFLIETLLATFTSFLPASLVPLVFNGLLNVFVVLHMLTMYRGRDVAAFYVITLVISNAFENLSILTGFPFGHYDYTDALGAKIFFVPVLVGASYVGAAYCSWVMALAILRQWRRPLTGAAIVVTPVFAAFFMVMWDLSFDPRSSTIRQWWIWRDGGAYFGVPVSNFLGWYLTVFVFMLVFALWLRWSSAQVDPGADTVSHRGPWFAAIAVYLAMGLNAVPLSSIADGAQVTDGSGQTWNVIAIVQAIGLVSLFTMLVVGLLALQAVLTSRRPERQN